MRLTLLGAMLALSVGEVAVPECSGAQERPDATTLLQYNLEKKNEWAAVGLEWIAPVLGHAYAGNYKRGILPGVVSLGGAALFVSGIRCDSLCSVGGKSMNSEGRAWTGLGILLVGRTWGFISAHDTAADHNAEVRQRLGVTFEPHPDRVEAGLSLRF